MSARARLLQALWDNLTEIEKNDLVDHFAHELAEQQRKYAEDEWTGSDARMILRRRVARHLADLIDPHVATP